MLSGLYITYLSLIISAIFPLILMPRMAEKLGAEQWGFFTYALFLQVLAVMIDHGLSQSIMREVTRLRIASEERRNAIYSALINKYGIVSGFLSGAICFFSIFFFEKEGVFLSIIYVGVVVFFQLRSSSYRALILAHEKHEKLAFANIFVIFFRFAIGYLMLFLIKPSYYFLLIWFVISYILDFWFKKKIANGFFSKIVVSKKRVIFLSDLLFKKAWFLSASVVLGVFCIYIDRLSVTLYMDKKSLGIYTIASSLALGVLQVVYPIGQVYTPKIIANINNKRALFSINKKLFIFVFVIYSLIFSGYFIIGDFVLNVWLHEYEAKNIIIELVPIFLIGCFLNSIYNIYYWNFIAFGYTNKIFFIYCFSAVATLFCSKILIDNFGLNGGAMLWALFHGSTVLCCVVDNYLSRKR